jgi:hypothetical protein
MKKIFLEEQVEEPVSEKQLKYIRDLMTHKGLYNSVFLTKLAFDTRNRLSKRSAMKLIDCLIKGEAFEILERK